MPITLPSETWDAFCRRVARAQAPICWSWAAVRGHDEQWQLAALCIRAAHERAATTLRYPDVLIRAEAIAPRTAASRLRRSILGAPGVWSRRLSLPSIADRVTGNWCYSAESMYLAPSGWPQYYMNTGFGPEIRASLPTYRPLSAAGKPYFPWLGAALAAEVFGIPPHQLQNYSGPLMIVALQDRRARISALTAGEDAVTASVESETDFNNLSLVAAWRANSGDAAWQQQAIALSGPGDVEITTGGTPSEMAVALVSSTGDVVDQRGWNEQAGSAPDALTDVHALVQRWLGEGEGPTVEFKQDLKGEPARVSFAETVAAFANAEGGAVLVGVRDDSTVAGYRPPKAADQIANIARDLVIEPVYVEIREVPVSGTYVQVVIVAAGDPARKPYRCRGRVMVRANATTREATTFEIRALAAQAVDPYNP